MKWAALRCRHRQTSAEPFCYVCMERVPPGSLTWATLLDIEPTPMHVECVDAFIEDLERRHPGLELRKRWA